MHNDRNPDHNVPGTPGFHREAHPLEKCGGLYSEKEYCMFYHSQVHVFHYDLQMFTVYFPSCTDSNFTFISGGLAN